MQAEECSTVVTISAVQKNRQHMIVGRCCFMAAGGKRGWEDLPNPNETVRLKKRNSWRNSLDRSDENTFIFALQLFI
jgi:hypothetical protein